MEFVHLSKEEYLSFQSHHPYANFLNSLEALAIKEKNGWKVELFGVKENGEILAATPLTSTKIMKIYRYYEAQRGFLMDYHDTKTLHFFVSELKRYMKDNQGLFCKISPHIVYQTTDEKGIPNTEENGQYIVDAMNQEGCQHQGFAHAYSTGSEVQWEYSLYLPTDNPNELLKHFSQPTRYSINKTLRQGIVVEKMNRDEMPTFLDVVSKTSKRRGFHELMREDQHFYDMFDYYGEHLDLLGAYLYPVSAQEKYQAEIQELEGKIQELDQKLADHPQNKKFLNQKKEYQSQIDAKEKFREEMKGLATQYGERILLSVGMFIYYPYELSYMYSGGVEEFSSYDGPYAIQWYTMQKAIELGIKHYNFYGISGDFSGNAIDQGVLNYKLGFNGTIEQMIGDFILPIRPMMYNIYRLLKR